LCLEIEGRRNRNSAHKVDRRDYASEDHNLHTLNVDLYKQKLLHIDKQKQSIPLFKEEFQDFEEITQTIENGVVVSEQRKIVKGMKKSGKVDNNVEGVRHARSSMPIDNDSLRHSSYNESLDVAEEQEGSQEGVQIAYTKTSHQNQLFHNPEVSNCNEESIKKKNSLIADSMKEASQPDNMSLLEESQEVILFNSDSKLSSPNNSQVIRKESMNRKEDPQITTNQILKPIPTEERHSPGPKPSETSGSLEKKQIEDSGSNDEPMYSDENSDSSGDQMHLL